MKLIIFTLLLMGTSVYANSAIYGYEGTYQGAITDNGSMYDYSGTYCGQIVEERR